MLKKIKVVSRGVVFTSRGKCRTPLLSPILEDTGSIFQMITAQRAKVVEVLNDGSEIELTILNFDKDNNGTATVENTETKTVEPKKDIKQDVVKEKTETTDTNKSEDNSSQQNTKLSRKERKKIEYQNKKQEESVSTETVKNDSEEVKDTAIPETAIEE